MDNHPSSPVTDSPQPLSLYSQSPTILKKIADIPPSDRPREKLLTKGARALSDTELLAVLLGKGTHTIDVMTLADKLVKIIDRVGVNVAVDDIVEIEGMGFAKASLIVAAFEFVRRRIRPEGMKIVSPADVLPLIAHYAARKQEHFISVSINGANEVMSIRVVTIGLIDRTHIHPREVFADIIAERASAVIIAHNHPAGVVTPSREDREVTTRIAEAGKILGIQLLDHIVFSVKGYYSFIEHDELS